MAPSALVEHVVHVLLVGAIYRFIRPGSIDLFFNLSLELPRVAAIPMTIRGRGLSHVTPRSTARVEVLIAAVEGAIGASEHLVAQLASNEGLRGQNARLVLPGSRGLFGSTSRVMMERCSTAALVGCSHRTEAVHFCVHLELI